MSCLVHRLGAEVSYRRRLRLGSELVAQKVVLLLASSLCCRLFARSKLCGRSRGLSHLHKKGAQERVTAPAFLGPSDVPLLGARPTWALETACGSSAACGCEPIASVCPARRHRCKGSCAVCDGPQRDRNLPSKVTCLLLVWLEGHQRA